MSTTRICDRCGSRMRYVTAHRQGWREARCTNWTCGRHYPAEPLETK